MARNASGQKEEVFASIASECKKVQMNLITVGKVLVSLPLNLHL